MARIHHLYRCLDADDELLYIGISWSAAARMAQHRAGSSWWKRVATIRLEAYPNRRAAEVAEREAIRRERPLFNKAHSEVGPLAEEPDPALVDWQVTGAARNKNGRWDIELLPPGGTPDLAVHNIEAPSVLEAMDEAIRTLVQVSPVEGVVIPLSSRRRTT